MPTLHSRLSPAPRSSRTSIKRRVLIADPDPEVRRAVKRALGGAGYVVDEADDGLELINAIFADIELSTQRGADYTTLSLLIVEAAMPGFSGLEALSMLRSLEWPTPVILTSSAANTDLDRKTNTLGAASVLDKPFEMADLRALITFIMPSSRGS